MPSFAQFGNDLYTGKRVIDFVGKRRVWYAVAAVAILISLLGLGIRGINAGIEFSGGSEIDVAQAKTTDEGLARKAVASVLPGAITRVSVINSNGVRIQTNKLSNSQLDRVAQAVAKAYGVSQDKLTTSFVGPSWGKDVSNKALTGLVVFLLLVAAVIAAYFRTWKMAIAGLVALVHDLLITIGVYALVGFEVTPASVIGFLTILGYSLYDTVVVFDKVRENTDHITATTKRTFGEAANQAVNQTLVRSINTSVVALLPVGSILFIGTFLLGAGTLKDISLALFVGIAVGTYSSIFIATPFLVHLREGEPALRAQAERVLRRRAELAARQEGAAGEPVTAGAASASGGAASATAPGGPVAGRSPAAAGAAARNATGGAATSGQRQQPRRGGGSGRPQRPGGRKR